MLTMNFWLTCTKLLSIPKQDVLAYAALQAQRTVTPGGHNSPYARLMVVKEHADVAYPDKPEVNRVCIKQQLSAVALYRTGLLRAHRAVLPVGKKRVMMVSSSASSTGFSRKSNALLRNAGSI